MSGQGEIVSGPGSAAAAFQAALTGQGAPPEMPEPESAGREPEKADPPPEPRSGGYDVGRINREFALVLMGSKAVVMREARGPVPVEDQQRFISVDAFRLWKGNTFTEVMGANLKVRAMSHAERWLGDRDRRQYSGITFFPNPDGAPEPQDYLNLWRGFAYQPKQKENGYAIFRDHIFTNLCEGNEKLFRWVFGWFAHMVQRPRERVGTALVIRGRMGTGKTKIGEVFGSLFPAHYFAVDDPRYVTGQFNAHMASCLLLQAEEAVWAGDKAAEGRLKGLVTSTFQMVENKGIDPIRLDNYVRLMMTSNEGWVVPAGKDERRFCVLDIAPTCAQNTDYFREMEEELASGGREALLHDLLTFDLSGVDLRRIPRTKALMEQKLASFDSFDKWWHGCLYSGAPTSRHRSWPDFVTTKMLFEDYLRGAEHVGWRRREDMTSFGMKLNKMGAGLRRARRTHHDDDGSQTRQWGYVLPPLEDCRAHWVEDMGQTFPWPEDDENEHD